MRSERSGRREDIQQIIFYEPLFHTFASKDLKYIA